MNMNNAQARTAQLVTQRLLLRPFRDGDASDLHAYLSLELTYRFEPGVPLSLAECALLARRRSSDPAYTAVCVAPEYRLVGHVYLCEMQVPAMRTWELGFALNPDYQGHGYAREACAVLLARAFDAHRAHRIVAQCSPQNHRSRRTLESLGFQLEGIFRQHVYFNRNEDGSEAWVDSCQYALLEDSAKEPGSGATSA